MQSQALAQSFDSAYYAATCALYLGIVTLQQEDYRQAWNLLRKSLHTFWDAGYTHFALAPILRMSQLLLHQDEVASAAEILAATARYPAHHQYHAQFEVLLDPFEELRQQLIAKLGPERVAAAWARGTRRELSAVVAELLS